MGNRPIVTTRDENAPYTVYAKNQETLRALTTAMACPSREIHKQTFQRIESLITNYYEYIVRSKRSVE